MQKKFFLLKKVVSLWRRKRFRWRFNRQPCYQAFFYIVSTLFTLYCMCLPSLFIPSVNFTVKFI